MPTFDHMTPTHGEAGDRVGIYGTALDTVTAVTFGAATALIWYRSSGGISVFAPPNPDGAVPVTLEAPDGDVAAGTFTYGAPPVVIPPPTAHPCIRKAWLTHGGRTLPLEDTAAGYICTELDLGWPEVRDVTNARPDADGIDDRTRYFGSRGVSANILATSQLGAVVDDVASAFGYYMRPDLRPELHYVLEREGNPERVLTVRGSGYSWPIDGGGKREVSLQWVAADPIARSAEVSTANAWAGSATVGGRRYDLAFNRIYPPGGGSSTVAAVVTVGDVPVYPLIRVYGPATAPVVYSTAAPSGGGAFLGQYEIAFKAGYVVDAGHYVEVDNAAHTAYLDGDRALPVLDQILWSSSSWIVFLPQPAHNTLWMHGGSTASGITQVEALWRDGWLT